MKTLSRALALVLVASTCLAQDVARLEQAVQANVQNKTFMGTVLVARGGEIVLSKGYGLSGYLVLGSIIESISGGSYAAFVQANIFTPLGMKDSGYDSNTAIIPRRASGHTPGPDGPLQAGYLHMTIPHAAGALYSTTEDLLRWNQALFSGTLLSAASLQKMTTPFKNDYALGVAVRMVNGRKVVSHSGGINGFNSFLSYYPDSRVTVAVLANINGPAADQMGPQLGALTHGDAMQLTGERKEIVR